MRRAAPTVSSDSTSTPPGATQRPASTQITEYLAANGGRADPNALYTVWIGANDILQNSDRLAAGQINATQFQTNVLAAATAEVGQIGRLVQAGARYIIVVGMPDLGLTPRSQAGGAAAVAGATALARATT
jgi:outer membrane lipase/esterase